MFEDILSRSAYALSKDAGCFCPDNLTSEGATFLCGVRNATVAEIIWTMDNHGCSAPEAVDTMRDGGMDAELADGAVPTYTHDMWKTFVDIGGYQEDITEHGFSTFEDAAQHALYMIADRLMETIFEEVCNAE